MNINIGKQQQREAIVFSPELQTDDPLAAFWLFQATVRLRRELCWRLAERAGRSYASGSLSSVEWDRLQDSLDKKRVWEDKLRFFQEDPTARFLSDQLDRIPSQDGEGAPRGSFTWLVRELSLDDTSMFALALALLPVFDNAAGGVVAACQNDPARVYPTLSLVQKLWDFPREVLALADPGHPLIRLGLLAPPVYGSVDRFSLTPDWESPLAVPVPISRQLLGCDSQSFARETDFSSAPPVICSRGVEVSWISLLQSRSDSLWLLPIFGKKGCDHFSWADELSRATGRPVFRGGAESAACDLRHLRSLVTVCWLKNVDLYLPPEAISFFSRETAGPSFADLLMSIQTVPITVFLGIDEENPLHQVPSHLLLPAVHLPASTFSERVELWKSYLPELTGREWERIIDECSRRFRFEKLTIASIAMGLTMFQGEIDRRDLFGACRRFQDVRIGDLGQKVVPRFSGERLILPSRHQQQYREVVNAMRSLADVHYGWGTGDAWNESGLSVLFSGAPGTGKTMAAEMLALELDLPMYRIDLSQVVNKYIGETEKNLKRLFDAADDADIILFFDEADALFGRRSEVRDSHDRYANLEISYLLERMERFKGLAILATNRKKDLDEAFLRRLRYIIDFPMPETEERLRIWRQATPEGVEVSGVDFDFLARQFQLSGGNIRSIVFNACLQCAALFPDPPKGRKGTLKMEQVLVSVKREYEKLNRSFDPQFFGPYKKLINEMEKGDARNPH